MGRIQRFIVKVKKAEKQKRDQKTMNENPSKDKDKDKIAVPKTLNYEHDTQEAMQILLRRPGQQDYVNSKDWEKAARLCNFMTHSRWCRGKEETEAGTPGISWIEFYILFKLHDSKNPWSASPCGLCTKSGDEKQLAKKSSLQSDLAEF